MADITFGIVHAVTATERLVEAARAGDRDAFGRLYEEFAPMVHGILMSRVDRADVDDLVHDVFLGAMRNIGALRKPDAFGGWLAEIARNCATDHVRGRIRRREKGEADVAPEDRPEPSIAPLHNSEADAILRALRSLPAAYRETLTLRLVEGMTGPEIAAKTGLTPGSVRVNLHRGMKRLRSALERTPS